MENPEKYNAGLEEVKQEVKTMIDELSLFINECVMSAELATMLPRIASNMRLSLSMIEERGMNLGGDLDRIGLAIAFTASEELRERCDDSTIRQQANDLSRAILRTLRYIDFE